MPFGVGGTAHCVGLYCRDDDSRILCITEQRSGYQGFIRVFEINRDSASSRELRPE